MGLGVYDICVQWIPYIRSTLSLDLVLVFVGFIFEFLAHCGPNLALGRLPEAPERSTLQDSDQGSSKLDHYLQISTNFRSQYLGF